MEAPSWVPSHGDRILRRLERDLFPRKRRNQGSERPGRCAHDASDTQIRIRHIMSAAIAS